MSIDGSISGSIVRAIQDPSWRAVTSTNVGAALAEGLVGVEPISDLLVVRGEDLFVVHFEFVNLSLGRAVGVSPFLERTDPSVDSFLIAHFPPQALAEEVSAEERWPRPAPSAWGVPQPDAPGFRWRGPWLPWTKYFARDQVVHNFSPWITGHDFTSGATFVAACWDWEPSFYEPGPGPRDHDGVLDVWTGPPRAVQLGGPSRVAFRVPPFVTRVPFSLAGLLNWEILAPSLVTGGPRPPGPSETSIELPYHLVLQPGGSTVWRHVSRPKTGFDGSVELWRTSLASSTGQPPSVRPLDQLASTLAVPQDRFPPPSPPLPPGTPPILAELTLLDSDREHIVSQSWHPAPVDVPASRLALSAVGGWLSASYNWGQDSPLSQWSHVGTMGREHHVVAVREGRLLPFGHRAAYVTISDRRIERFGVSTKDARVVTKSLLFIREPVVSTVWPGLVDVWTGVPIGAVMPFKSVRISTPPTVSIRSADPAPGPSVAFIPSTESGPLLFTLVGTDVEGRLVPFQLPLAFAELGASQFDVDKILVAWGKLETTTAAVSSRRIAFAEPSTPGDTALITEALTFTYYIDWTTPATEEHGVAAFIAKARVHLPGAAEVTGGRPLVIAAAYAPAYIASEPFAAATNPDQVFLAIDPADPAALDFGGRSDRTGAMATPKIRLGAISRLHGSMIQDPDPDQSVSTPNPTGQPATPGVPSADALRKLFDGFLILGSIPVSDLFTGTPDVKLQTISEATGDQVTTLTLNLALGATNGFFHPRSSTTLDVTVTITAAAQDSSGPQTVVTADLSQFDLHFGPVRVGFKSLHFAGSTGQKPVVSAVLDPAAILFEGALGFLNDLRPFLVGDGMSNPPFVDVGPDGVTTGYALGLPDLAIGVLALQHVNLRMAVELPFASEAGLSFDFATTDHPFLVTVAAFGGGGHLHVSTGASSVREIDASIEFGGSLELDVVVASGGVSVMAGIYFSWNTTELVFSAFLRATGYLEVLGLVSVSVELYLALLFVDDNGAKSLSGTATVTLDVHVAFFSQSVSFTVQRTFAGSASDPTFKQLVDGDDWRQYWSAFAPISP